MAVKPTRSKPFTRRRVTRQRRTKRGHPLIVNRRGQPISTDRGLTESGNRIAAVRLPIMNQRTTIWNSAMRILFILISATLLLTAPGPAFADTYNSAERTISHTLESGELAEQRTIFVRTPPGYDPALKYPVVYVTDGEWSFELVASYLDYMADNGVYPPLIVTAVTNVNRNRDFVPRADAHFDDTGGADSFLAFVGKEWIPFIADRYPVNDNRVLLGHSFGGVFALHTFFTQSDLFEAYVALGSSAWIADRVLFEEAGDWFKSPQNADAFVYMAVGEGDGGPTTPSSRDLAAMFEQRAPASLQWTFDVTPKTDHFKNMASGMHDAFMSLFPAWGFSEQLTTEVEENGADGVDQWFVQKQSQLGFRFIPAWFDLGVVAQKLVRSEHADAAMAIMKHLRRHYPGSPDVAAFSAGVYERSDRPEQAAEEYRRAIQIATEDGLHPNAIHLARLQRGLARVTKID